MPVAIMQQLAATGYSYVDPVVARARAKVSLADAIANKVETYASIVLQTGDKYIDATYVAIDSRATSLKARALGLRDAACDMKSKAVAAASQQVDKAKSAAIDVANSTKQRALKITEKVSEVAAPVTSRVVAAKSATVQKATATKAAAAEKAATLLKMLKQRKQALSEALQAKMSLAMDKLRKLKAWTVKKAEASKQSATAAAEDAVVLAQAMLAKTFGEKRVNMLSAKVKEVVAKAYPKVTPAKKVA